MVKCRNCKSIHLGVWVGAKRTEALKCLLCESTELELLESTGGSMGVVFCPHHCGKTLEDCHIDHVAS